MSIAISVIVGLTLVKVVFAIRHYTGVLDHAKRLSEEQDAGVSPQSKETRGL